VREDAMTAHELVDELARRVMGWRPLPDRFLRRDRSWLPRWRFDPLNETKDAFLLLELAGTEAYTLSHGNGRFAAHVRISGREGTADGESKPRTITLALARALGLDTEGI
jgi:hypothetical protein